MAATGRVDIDAAYECVRAGQHQIERQLREHQTALDRAASMIRLTVAKLGGITAITGYLIAHSLLTKFTSILLIASVLVGVVAAFLSIRVAVGAYRKRPISIGPEVGPLVRSLMDDDANLTEILVMLAEGYDDAVLENNWMEKVAHRSLVVASYLVGLSATLALTAILYIAGGFIQ